MLSLSFLLPIHVGRVYTLQALQCFSYSLDIGIFLRFFVSIYLCRFTYLDLLLLTSRIIIDFLPGL